MEMRERLQSVQDKILGPRDGRDSTSLPFEQHWRASKVQDTKRCYSLSMTVEAPKRTGAPVVSGRMDDSMELDEHQVVTKDLIEVPVTHLRL